MLQLEIPDAKYILPLDSLDLNFLSQYVQNPVNDTKALWSKSFLDGESAYCEVEIVTEGSQGEDSYVEPFETYTCYICNVDVPVIYYKQHMQSKKHQTYKGFSGKVLENVAKQIHIDIDHTYDDKLNDMFYCEICSRVVAVKHKREHYKSNYHIKAVESEALANIFLENYIQNINFDSKIEAENDKIFKEDKNEIFAQSNKEAGVDSYSPYDSENDDASTKLCDKIISNNNNVFIDSENLTAYDSDDDVSSLVSSSNETMKYTANFQLYLKDMLAKYKLQYKIPDVEDDCVVIVTPKGYKEKISFHTFHGYKRIDNIFFCHLCQIWEKLSNMILHSTTEEHVKNIVRPINDSFARQVINQNTISRQEEWIHCLLCNKFLPASNDHATLDPNHKKYIQTKTLKSDKKSVLPKKTFCTVCKIDIDTHNFLAHTKASKHKNNAKAMMKKPNNVLVQENPAPHKALQNNDSEEFCNTCNVKVPKGGMSIHNLGKPHCNNLKTMKNKANVITAKNILPSTSKSQSQKNTNAQLKLNEPKIKVSDLETVNKKILRKYVYEDPTNDSPIAIGYRQKHVDLLERNKIYRMDNSSYYCYVCLISLSRISEIDHMLGERHRFTLNSNK